MEFYIQTERSYLGKIHADIDDLLYDCVQEVDGNLNETPTINVFGREAVQHRNIGFFSDISEGYRYSRQLSASKPLTPSLSLLLELVNTEFNTDFNGILVNEYPDGTHYIGKHSDDESALSNAGVVCISYGASRKFRIRNKLTGTIVMDIPTTSKEIWVMGGDFQKEFTHEVPVEKKVKEKRISFTFRKHLK
jgi:alkylated DNA repair dioxygenase AlkB